jgi:hypothetical protein
MIKQEGSTRLITLTVLVLAAAATRALPIHVSSMWNFTAVGALAIFAGAHFNNKGLAFLIPLTAMAVSDIFIGDGFNEWVYLGFIAMVVCGVFIQSKISVANVAMASVIGALVFFLITNFAFLYPWYPHNLQGIIQSYIAGLPFLLNMLASDAIYGTLLFGSFYLLEKRFPKLAV